MWQVRPEAPGNLWPPLGHLQAKNPGAGGWVGRGGGNYLRWSLKGMGPGGRALGWGVLEKGLERPQIPLPLISLFLSDILHAGFEFQAMPLPQIPVC